MSELRMCILWAEMAQGPPEILGVRGEGQLLRGMPLAWISRNPVRKAKISAAFAGELHWNWQGGKARLNSISYRGRDWKKQRQAAVVRDGFACVDCGMGEAICLQTYGRRLDVDHIEPFHNFTNSRAANRLSNLASRCASCHRKAEARRIDVQMVLPLSERRNGQHRGYVRGAQVNTARLNEVQVAQIRRRLAEGELQSVLAREFGLSKSSMSALALGKSWRHVGEAGAFRKAGLAA